jgi:NAD(P)-dependent dehydrogenase (short-subunit alcohol dehydrogenase family)
MVSAAVDAFGAIDVVVTSGGVGGGGIRADELADADYMRVIDVNLNGTFWTARAVAREMIAAGRGGRMVLIGSVRSQLAMPGGAAYCASKGGVLMLGRALAVDWAPYGICVNVLGPGITDTPAMGKALADPSLAQTAFGRIPFGRPASPNEIAEVAAFLASPAAAYMTGAFVPVDGGWLAASPAAPAKSA